MNNFIGYVTTVADVTQKSAESVGESFKTIYSRFGNVKAGKFVALQEDKEKPDYNEDEYDSLNDIETVLTSIGIKLRNNADEWRNIDDVLKDIAEQWDGFDQTTKNAVATAVAGTRQRENVLQLFSNWDRVGTFAEIAANSYGTATEKMKAYTDTVEAARQRMQVAIEEWALKLNQADTIKDFYDSLTSIINNIDKLAYIVSALALVLAPNQTIGLFANGLTKLGNLLVNIGFSDSKIRLNWMTATNNGGSLINGGVQTVKNNFIDQQNAVLGPTLDAYKNSIKDVTLANLKTAQKQMLFIQAKDKQIAASILEAKMTEDDMKETLKKMDITSRRTFIESLIMMAESDEVAQILRSINVEDMNNISNEQLGAITQVLTSVRTQSVDGEKVLLQISKNLRQSSMMPSAVVSATSGLVGMGGMFLGSGAGGYVAEKYLGMDESTAKLIGGSLGSMIGMEAGKSLVTSFASISTVGLAAALPGIIASGLVVVGLIWQYTKAQQEKRLQEEIKLAEEEFKIGADKLKEQIGARNDVQRYDELAKGINKFGNNIALTNEEYEEFIKLGNSLAEVFPELIVQTDEFGNKLLGIEQSNAASTIGNITDEVNNLTEAQKKANARQMFSPEILGNLVEGNVKEKEELEKQLSLLKEIKVLKESGAQSGADVSLDYTGSGAVFNRENQQYFDMSVNELDSEIINLQNDINNLSKDYNSYADNIIYRNSDIKDSYDELTDAQKLVYNNLMHRVDLTDTGATTLNAQPAIKKLTESAQKYIDLINSNSDLIENALNPSINVTFEEAAKQRQELFDSILYQFNQSGKTNEQKMYYWEQNEEIKDFIKSLGFDINERGNIYDPQNLVNRFDEVLKPNGNITMDIINKLPLEKANKAFEMLKENSDRAYYSVDSFLNLLYADEEKPKTVEGMQEYIAQEIAMIEQVNKISDYGIVRFSNFNIEDRFSFAPEAIRNQLINIQNQIKEGEITTSQQLNESINRVVDNATTTLLADFTELSNIKLNDYFNFEGLKIDGQIDTFSELKTVLDETADSYRRLADAEAEQAKNGELSLKTVLDLITSNVNYASVLKFVKDERTGEIESVQLDTDAKIKLTQAQLLETAAEFRAIAAEKKQQIELKQQEIVALKASQSMSTATGANDDFTESTNTLGKSLDNVLKVIIAFGEGIRAIVRGDFASVKSSIENALNSYQSSFTSTTVDRKDGPPPGTNKRISEISTEIYKLQQEYDNYEYVANELWDLGNSKDFKELLGFGKDSSSKSGSSSKYDPKTVLDWLKKEAEQIDKEWEAVMAKREGRYTDYFAKKGKNLQAQLIVANAQIEELESKPTPTDPKEADELREKIENAKKDRVSIEKELINLDDEEIQDKISLLKAQGASNQALIYQQQLLVKAADNEQELVERQEELNNLLEQEEQRRKNILEFQQGLIESQLKYNKAEASSSEYKNLRTAQRNNLQEQIREEQARLDRERQRLYAKYSEERDNNGNRIRTFAESWALVNEDKNVQDIVNNIIKLTEEVGNSIVDEVEGVVDEIQRSLDKLNNEKPKEWTSIDQIKKYTDSTISYLNQKMTEYNKALASSNQLTDDQIVNLVDKLNDVAIALHEAQIQQYEDITNYQDKTFSALVNQIGRYKDELIRIKAEVTKAYDDEIDKLKDRNDAEQDYLKLLELQKNLQNAMQEKQRVFRAGLGWVYESPRDKVKKAQRDLDNYYDDQKLDDLQKAKDEELKLLDERIKDWDNYLTALQQRHEQFQVMQEQKLLFELTNTDNERDLYNTIYNDMMEYNSKVEFAYDDYTGIFEDFLATYKQNLIELQTLKEKELSLLSANAYTSLNNTQFDFNAGGHYNQTGGYTTGGKWESGKDYFGDALTKAKSGDLTGALSDWSLRGAKISDTGVNHGTTQEEAYKQIMNAYNGKNYTISNGTTYTLKNGKWVRFAGGLDEGAVIGTGLAQLDGSPEEPEFVLTNDQATNAVQNYSDLMELASNDLVTQGSEDTVNKTDESNNTQTFTTKQSILEAINTIIAQVNWLLSISQANELSDEQIRINTDNLLYIKDNGERILQFLDSMYESVLADYEQDTQRQEQLMTFLEEFQEYLTNALQGLQDFLGDKLDILANDFDTHLSLMQELISAINGLVQRIQALENAQKEAQQSGGSMGYSGGGGGSDSSDRYEKGYNIEDYDLSQQMKIYYDVGDMDNYNRVKQERKVVESSKSGVASTDAIANLIEHGDTSDFDLSKKSYFTDKLKGYATGLDKGPVTETGLTILHGSQDNPEFVLNDKQATNAVENYSELQDMATENDAISAISDASSISEMSDSRAVGTEEGLARNSENEGLSNNSETFNANGISSNGNKEIEIIINQLNYLLSIVQALQLNGQNIQGNTDYLIMINDTVLRILENLSAMQELEITNYENMINFLTETKEELKAMLQEALQGLQDVIVEKFDISNDDFTQQLDLMNKLITTMEGVVSYIKQLESQINAQNQAAGGGGGGGGGGYSSDGINFSKKSATDRYMEDVFGNASDNDKSDVAHSAANKSVDFSDAYERAIERGASQKVLDSIEAERIAKVDKQGYDPNPGWKEQAIAKAEKNMKEGRANGILGGPVDYTGLMMLHGSPSKPEYVLNNDQAYNLLRNMSTMKMAQFESSTNNDNGTNYVINGDIILENCDNPAEFWNEVTSAMGNRTNVTKNK